MPAFKCSQCTAVENTATSDYWTRLMEKKPALCSECSEGTWHGRFPKMTVAERGLVERSDGFLYDER